MAQIIISYCDTAFLFMQSIGKVLSLAVTCIRCPAVPVARMDRTSWYAAGTRTGAPRSHSLSPHLTGSHHSANVCLRY